MVSPRVNHKINMGGRKRSSDRVNLPLRGEKLKDKEVRATKRVGKWSLGRKMPRKEAKPIIFFGQPERCRATREKNRKLEGSQGVGGRGLIRQEGRGRWGK